MEWKQHSAAYEYAIARANDLIQAGRRTVHNFPTDRIFGFNGGPLLYSRHRNAARPPVPKSAPRDDVDVTEETLSRGDPQPAPAPTTAQITDLDRSGGLDEPPNIKDLTSPSPSPPPPPPPDDNGDVQMGPEQSPSTSPEPSNFQTPSSSMQSSSSSAIVPDVDTAFVPYDWYQTPDGFDILKLVMGNLNLPTIHCLLRTHDGYSATTHRPRGLTPTYNRIRNATKNTFGAVVPMFSDSIGDTTHASPAPAPAPAPAPTQIPAAEQTLDLGDQRNVTQRVMFGFPSTLNVVHVRQERPVVNYRDPPYPITAKNVVAFVLDPTLFSAIRTIETVLQRTPVFHTLMAIVNFPPDTTTKTNVARFISVQHQYLVATASSRKKVFASRIKDLRDEVMMIHAYFQTIDMQKGKIVFHANDRASGTNANMQPYPLRGSYMDDSGSTSKMSVSTGEDEEDTDEIPPNGTPQ